MKERKITEDQIQKIANVLLEVQAKFSLEALDILRSLPLIVEPEKAE